MGLYRDRFLTYLLTPLSWIYGAAVTVRNKMYDAGLLKEHVFDIPVICVGNITVGGTGKTPHVEHLISEFENRYNIAVISRGYKRKTKGYVLANKFSTPEQIGDEAYQIFRKFGDRVKVAVCENRRRGISRILKTFPDTNLVILDDGFQHRSVRPTVSILLMDKNRPLEDDNLLPLGRLREPTHSADRADIVVVTKCPDRMDPIDFRVISNGLKLLSFQKLFFSSTQGEMLRPVFPDEAKYSVSLASLTEDDSVLLLSGIASPRSFVKGMKPYPFSKKVMAFPDHHDFSKADIKKVRHNYDEMEGNKKIIVTTEKDAVRLMHNPYFPHSLKPYVFYQPISVRMHYGITGEEFRDAVEEVIKTNSANI